MDHREKPGTPGTVLEHYGKKGMHWGVVNEDEPVGRDAAARNETEKQKIAKISSDKQIRPGTPEFQKMVETAPEEKHGLSRNQKMLLAFGAVAAAGAGYYAYKHYAGPRPDPELLKKIQANAGPRVTEIEGMKLPAKWDTSGLKHGPISKQALGDLAGGEFNAKLHNIGDLTINTSRGYADIVPKNGFKTAFAAEQHASVTRVLEGLRDKYPAVRNMNVEVVPMSHVPGYERHNALMSVMPMRAGEARVMYNDFMDKPSAGMIKNNLDFLPGLGKKDYVAHHEMGHLLAAAHGELPAGFDIVAGNAGAGQMIKRGAIQNVLHKQMFKKHGFTFKELSKLSGYAASEPAEAMAELHGHYSHPEMRSRLTSDQVTRAKAMFDEMGGLT